MPKFYQPKETQGIYDAALNRLTVNQDDEVLIGFKAWNKQEYENTDLDASEDIITARYSIDPTTVELELDTSTAGTFRVTATQDVMMSATPKNVLKPLEVVVRRHEYDGKPAVGQGRDPAGCWAACLS